MNLQFKSFFSPTCLYPFPHPKHLEQNSIHPYTERETHLLLLQHPLSVCKLGVCSGTVSPLSSISHKGGEKQVKNRIFALNFKSNKDLLLPHFLNLERDEMGIIYEDAVEIKEAEGDCEHTVITVNCPDKTGLGCDLCRIILLFGISISRGGRSLMNLTLPFQLNYSLFVVKSCSSFLFLGLKM